MLDKGNTGEVLKDEEEKKVIYQFYTLQYILMCYRKL